MKKLSNNAGVTIAELMIYIVLGLIVVGYALSAMTDMAKGYTRTRTVMKMQKDGRDAIQIMAREIANTGFKYYIHDTTVAVKTTAGTNSQTFYTTRPTRFPVVYTTNSDAGATQASNPPKQLVLSSQLNWLRATYCGNWNRTETNIIIGEDFGVTLPTDTAASFRFRNQAGTKKSDTLVFYAGVLNPAGNRIQAVHKVVYWLDEATKTIQRKEQMPHAPDLNIDSRVADGTDGAWGDASSPTTMALIDRVVALQFMFSKDGINWDNDPTKDAAGNDLFERHLIKMIKIQMVVESDKTQKSNASPNIPAKIGRAHV